MEWYDEPIWPWLHPPVTHNEEESMEWTYDAPWFDEEQPDFED